VLGKGAINNLQRASGAHDIAPEPHLAIAPLANAPNEFVIADVGGEKGFRGDDSAFSILGFSMVTS
jgi:hypothetical protein